MKNKNTGNIDLGKTQITPLIRVSSAAIFYGENWFGDYYQYETFIFSDDTNLKSRMFIWGTSGKNGSPKLTRITETAHRRIAKVMLQKYIKS